MPVPTTAPTAADAEMKSKIRQAVLRVRRRYPGPAGTILAKELEDLYEFGYRIGTGTAVWQLVEELNADAPAEVGVGTPPARPLPHIVAKSVPSHAAGDRH